MNEVANAIVPSHAVPTGVEPSSATGELFVINLCASMTPMPSVPKSLAGFEEFKLYQVSRVEDGRRRYRLRLGFFSCQAEAELLLAAVRALYPAAFSTAVAQDDMRFYSELPAGAKPVAVAPSKPAAAVIAQPAALTTIVAPIAEAPQATNREEPTRIMPAPRAESANDRQPQAPVKAHGSVEATLELAPAPKAVVPTGASTPVDAKPHDDRPFHVARGVTVPDVALELAPEPVAKKPVPVVAPATRDADAKSKPITASQATKPAVSAPRATPAATRPAATSLTAPELPSRVNVVDDYVPILDTTLTIRTLTQSEKDNPDQPKWFVVELTSSEHPFNLESMPRLDIFAAYRLYSVIVSDGAGKLRHALRLGFFREEVSAQAVSGYLKTFFPTPTITRIGVAEYNRFAEPKPKPTPAPETAAPPVSGAAHNVVQLSDKREYAAPTTHTTPTSGKPVSPAGGTRPAVHNGKLAPAAINKGAGKQLASDSGIRMARPQSFLARLIGRDLD